MPDAELSDNQVVLLLALQLKIPPPVLLILNVCEVGLPLPCCAVKDRLNGLVPITGSTETTGDEGGVINCANPGISAANRLIDRPPALLFPDAEAVLAFAAARGVVPVGFAPPAIDPVTVAGDGATLMVARGTATPRLLFSEEGSVGWEVTLSLAGDGGCAGMELTGEELDGEGSMDAMGAFCGFRINRCGLRDKVCASFF